MLRIIVLLILILLTLIEMKKNISRVIYWLVLAGLTLMLVLRFGQGSDFFNYNQIFIDVGQYGEERTFDYILRALQMLKVSYPMFLGLVGLFSMTMLYLFIKRFCSYRFFPLLIMYSIYYITYYESAIRQLIAMSIAFVLIYPGIIDKNFYKVILGLILATMIHTSAIIMILFLLAYFISDELFNRILFKHYLLIGIGIFILVCVSVILSKKYNLGITSFIQILPDTLKGKVSFYNETSPSSLFALASRLLFFVGISFLYLKSKQSINKNDIMLYKIYIIGFILYILLFNNALIASRLNAYFKIAEIVLIPNLIIRSQLIGWKLYSTMIVIIGLLTAFYCKEVYNAMLQMEYYNPSYFNYPYVSYYNKKSLLEYRGPDKYNLVYGYLGINEK